MILRFEQKRKLHSIFRGIDPHLGRFIIARADQVAIALLDDRCFELVVGDRKRVALPRGAPRPAIPIKSHRVKSDVFELAWTNKALVDWAQSRECLCQQRMTEQLSQLASFSEREL